MAGAGRVYGNRSLAAMAAVAVLAKTFHPVMLLAAEWGQNAAWLVTLLATLLAALLVWPVAAALRRQQAGTLISVARRALGRPGAVGMALSQACAFTFMAAMILRETSEMALTVAFPHSPQTIATTTLLLGAVYIAWGDRSGLVRLGTVLLPLLLAALLVVTVGAMPWGEWWVLFPLWGPGPERLLLGAPVVAKFFAPMGVLFMLAGGVRDRKRLPRWAVGVTLATGTLLTLVKLVLGVVLPYPKGVAVTFPLHLAARILLGGRFFERLEGLWLFVWVSVTVILSAALLYASAAALQQAFRLQTHRAAVLPLAAVTLTLAFFPENQADTVRLHEGAAGLLAALTLGLPALLAVIALLRGRGAPA